MKPGDTPTGRAALAIRALYAEHAVGGHLHIVTDDHNLGDECLRHCREAMESSTPRPATGVEWDALNALEALSVTARRKAIATRDDEKWSP